MTTIDSQSSRSGIIASIGASLLGLAIHNALEFCPASFLDVASGFIPLVVIEGALLLIWTQGGTGRRAGSYALLALGLINLIGGGLISVLPLDFLPFDPEQSVSHYVSHVIYGVLQIPLILMSVQSIRRSQ